MILLNIQKNDEKIKEIISEYYDFEMPESKRLQFEAILAKQNRFRKYFNQEIDSYYLVSKSIKKVKAKIAIQHQCHFVLVHR